MNSYERKHLYDVEEKCPYCGEETVFMCEEFDAEFCTECDKWLEPKCGDPSCPYCSKRPGKPSDIVYFCL
ncbi:MAG: hypothetical protein IJZ95_00395 [Oscillospiraceae bacterium]|nr:hypothetical protein [Oscillospiraceae bacterium]